MKALFELFRRFDARRIFGFIRRFGSMSRPKVKCYDLRSTRALRVEGDSSSSRTLNGWSGFLSTPSGWRTTYFRIRSRSSTEFLSALSGWRATPLQNRKTNGCGVFLSTPSGWRTTYFRIRSRSSTEFLSALSGWRATPLQNRKTNGCGVFLSTPSGWRATLANTVTLQEIQVSIHALRVEGDPSDFAFTRKRNYFYPRPPGGGRRLG